jgi:hypothetical protein
MKIGSMITLPVDRIDEAPSVPGLYCWLARPDFETISDHSEAFDSDQELLRYVTSEFHDLIEASIPQDLDAAVNAPFGTIWQGPLKARTSARKGLSPKTKTEQACLKKSDVLLLSDLLRTSFPVFWAPLYTGVAINLRSRLQCHQRAYGAALKWDDDMTRSKIEVDDDEEAQARHLADRLKKCGYKPEQLTITLLPIEGIKTPAQMSRIRKIAEAAESWLNHFNMPRLGKL